MFSSLRKFLNPIVLRGFQVPKSAYTTSAEGKPVWRQTTILAVKKDNEICIIGDGQVSYGSTRVKTDGRKIRKLMNGSICGFAGSLGDAFTLMEGLENIMTKQPTLKACISYAKLWRTGKQLRHLEATMLIVDKDLIVELDGTGNVLEIPQVIGIGSGGQFAECAARALIDIPGLSAKEIALKSMQIAADKCIYTNHTWIHETIKWDSNEVSQDTIESIVDSRNVADSTGETTTTTTTTITEPKQE